MNLLEKKNPPVGGIIFVGRRLMVRPEWDVFSTHVLKKRISYGWAFVKQNLKLGVGQLKMHDRVRSDSVGTVGERESSSER